MFVEQRLAKIQEVLAVEQSASIERLSKLLSVSKDTIRRDLIQLEKRQVLKRTHGGAVSTNPAVVIYDYQTRAGQFYDIKAKIAKAAIHWIKQPAAIIFDASTTVEAVINELSDYPLQAITNSLTHAQRLAALKQSTITVLPGRLDKEQLFLYGADTVAKLAQFQADYTLLGVFALSTEGVFIHTEEEGMVKRQMVKQGEYVIAVADHTKLATTGFFKVCDLPEIDLLITDQQPDIELQAALAAANVTIYVTE